MARRVADLSQHVTSKLKSAMKNCTYFTVALDESVDVTDVSQLMIFARLVDESFEVQEELLTLHQLKGGTKGSDIYEAISTAVSEFGGFKKCSCIVTDGAKVMSGSKTGLVELLKENGILRYFALRDSPGSALRKSTENDECTAKCCQDGQSNKRRK